MDDTINNNSTAIINFTSPSSSSPSSSSSSSLLPFFAYPGVPLYLDSPLRSPESLRPLAFTVILVLYCLIVTGNTLLCFLIVRDPRLHRPMYILLANLSLNALVGSSATLPRAMRDLVAPNAITAGECLAQVYFIHVYMSLEYYILASMSLDRYLAVCLPLRYGALFGNERALRACAAVHAAAAACVSAILCLVLRLDLCRGRVVDEFSCSHMSLAKLACNDTSVNNVAGIAVTALTMGVGLAAIAASYARILFECCSSRGRRGRGRKAAGTCVAHLGSLGVFALCSLAIVAMPRVERYVRVSPLARCVVNMAVYVLPPLLNPVIYGLRTAEIRAWLAAKVCRRGKVTAAA
ncbi:olfactory receptor 52K1-like [Lethenteron reissneri]|uniref:olfactory receptor 52K1-like n=1 Tax=Lethenteron reissneri TaxID=7753 RepID=UPI002AB6E5E6|nr:olfactory receptor 52K1-like [Lethenteron reissneri]